MSIELKQTTCIHFGGINWTIFFLAPLSARPAPWTFQSLQVRMASTAYTSWAPEYSPATYVVKGWITHGAQRGTA
jgi:hypothetical protein